MRNERFLLLKSFTIKSLKKIKFLELSILFSTDYIPRRHEMLQTSYIFCNIQKMFCNTKNPHSTSHPLQPSRREGERLAMEKATTNKQ